MSTHRTRWPSSAKAAARFSVVVVLATPPFWLAKAMTLAWPVTSCSDHGRGKPIGTTSFAPRGGSPASVRLARTGRRDGPPIHVGGAPGALAITSTGVLVLDTESGDVDEIDPRSLDFDRVLHVAGFPTALAVGGGAAWVVDARSGTVTRLTGR